ncbi:hypothetical protein BI037_gp37 [Morganella phage vB_MmoP_MP2]|uniref:Uncharacterized protein n=1 Tax=Morganella phage vB_MmoP_MP2 TaxID=1852627 RepID=A0A192YB66_9CAUD|nr:hypothetical protein BI037_gp37 [Morganella phage vB_MmoP_MP2]ANM46370.1 hypothetical protein MP2_gp33 [Morganella phage vB_MmoP_MP2]
MIDKIKHYLKNPNDILAVPPAVKEYLSVRYNMSYLLASGELKDIRKKHDLSEEAVLGFIIGLEYAAGVLEEIDLRISNRQDD